jgi:hypothetical protein
VPEPAGGVIVHETALTEGPNRDHVGHQGTASEANQIRPQKLNPHSETAELRLQFQGDGANEENRGLGVFEPRRRCQAFGDVAVDFESGSID